MGVGGVVPSLMIDTSTIDPMTSQDMAAAARKARLHHDAIPFHNCSVSSPAFVDAPVSGCAYFFVRCFALLPGS